MCPIYGRRSSDTSGVSTIELRRLRYLIAVADAGHVTRAAEQLGIQQPPLTRAIRGLEDELGVRLFDRLPRGVALTPAGVAAVAQAKVVLAQADQVADAARRAARGEQGRLAVGYTSSAAFHPFVPRQIRAFGEASPGVRFTLEEDSTSTLVQALKDERLDAAFVRTPSAEAMGLRLDPLLEEAMLAAVPSGHALAAAGAVPLSALAGETFVLYRRPAGAGLYDAIIAACHSAGFSPDVVQEAPRLPSTLSLVAAGLGVTIVPASMARLDLEGVATLRLTQAGQLHAPLLLATRKADRSPLLERFRAMVTAAAAVAEI